MAKKTLADMKEWLDREAAREEKEKGKWVKDNNPDGTCWNRLRDLFTEDFHRNVRHCPLSLADYDTEFERQVVEYFRSRGYKLRARRPSGGDSIHIKLMKYWLEVPRDLAMKIMVLGAVPLLD